MPVEYFLRPAFRAVEFQLIGSHKMRFPGWLLPSSSDIEDLISTRENASVVSRNSSDYHLWGLTLSIVDDLLATCGIIARDSLYDYPSNFQSTIVKCIWWFLTLAPRTLFTLKWLALGIGAVGAGYYVTSKL